MFGLGLPFPQVFNFLGNVWDVRFVEAAGAEKVGGAHGPLEEVHPVEVLGDRLEGLGSRD